MLESAVGQKKEKENKLNIPIKTNANYRRKIKLIPINMDYCSLQFDVLKFFLGILLHKRSLLNINFFNVKPKI